MDFHHRKLKEVNELYSRHEITIEKLQAAVRREIPLLAQELQLTLSQVKALEAFACDKLTLFRYLRKNSFSLPTALSLLLDTMQWRLKERVEELTLTHVQGMLSSPLCFFRRQDKSGRPVLVIQLRYFPSTFRDNSELLESIMPLVVFVLETTRKLLLDHTEQRILQGHPHPIMSDLTILIDFKNANSLPKDFTLVQTFIKLLKRYPGMAGMVCLLNFGWMYQGMWQMIKMILSQEAKNRVAFPKLKELKTIIDETDLLSELGGKDEFQWDIKQDTMFLRYQQPLLRNTSKEKSAAFENRRSSISSHYIDNNSAIAASPAPLPYQQETTALDEGVSVSHELLSSISVYATPTGSVSPIEHEDTTHLENSTGALQRNTRSGLRAGIHKLLGREYQQPGDGISSSDLSQRLSRLQLEQRLLREKESPPNVKSRITFIFSWILSMERKLVVSIINYRAWIYCFVCWWMLHKVLRRLSLSYPLQLFITNQSAVSWLLSRRRNRLFSN